MGVPKKDLAQIEKQTSSQGSARCRAELFDVWMKQTQNASWELIAAALGKLGETVLAEKIRSRCVALVSSPQQLTASSTVKIVLDKSLVIRLSTLEREFASLVTNLKMSLKKINVSLKELESFLDIRLDLDGELSHVTSIDDLLQQIRPHFCLFNTVVLKDIIEKFIGKPLKQQLEEYESLMKEFTESAEITLLKEVEFLDQSHSTDMPQVIFKLTGFWPSVTIKRFQRFVDHVFEDSSSALTHIRVKQGCICVTWFTRKSMIPSLTARAQEKVLFMRHVEVMSLRVGDTVILEQEETETDLNTALVQAITADCTEAVEFLLMFEADPNCTDTSVNAITPLILACRNNSISIAKLLLEAGANVNAQVIDKWSSTALKVVCSLNISNMDLIELLVQSGAQVVVPGERVTALGFAAANGHTDIVQYLISKGAPVNDAQMYACCYGRSEIVHFLLTHGADPNIQDQNNNTALHSACYSQMTECVELLLAHGADPNIRGIKNATPLTYACIKNSAAGYLMDPSIIILLLTAGADLNARDESGFTPLMIAANNDYKEGVSFLLNAGASVNIQNIFGATALHEAAKKGFQAVSELLLASGAQALLINDNNGMTPLDYALDNNHHDVCQLFLANIDSNPLPAVTESTDTNPLPTRQEPIPPQHSSQHSSAFTTLDQLRYALEYPLSPADTIKHHQADEEGEENRN